MYFYMCTRACKHTHTTHKHSHRPVPSRTLSDVPVPLSHIQTLVTCVFIFRTKGGRWDFRDWRCRDRYHICSPFPLAPTWHSLVSAKYFPDFKFFKQQNTVKLRTEHQGTKTEDGKDVKNGSDWRKKEDCKRKTNSATPSGLHRSQFSLFFLLGRRVSSEQLRARITWCCDSGVGKIQLISTELWEKIDLPHPSHARAHAFVLLWKLRINCPHTHTCLSLCRPRPVFVHPRH